MKPYIRHKRHKGTFSLHEQPVQVRGLGAIITTVTHIHEAGRRGLIRFSGHHIRVIRLGKAAWTTVDTYRKTKRGIDAK